MAPGRQRLPAAPELRGARALRGQSSLRRRRRTSAAFAALRAHQLRHDDQPAARRRRQRRDQFYVDDNSAITMLDGGAGPTSSSSARCSAPTARSPRPSAPGDEITTEKVQLNSPQEIAEFNEPPVYNWLSRGISYATTAYGGDRRRHLHRVQQQGHAEAVRRGRRRHVHRPRLPARRRPTQTGHRRSTLVNGGTGNDHIEYNINAPVGIDGGTGFNTRRRASAPRPTTTSSSPRTA